MKFIDKVMVITGASSGIGEATARLFLKEEATVYNLDTIKPSGDDALSMHWIQCDVSDYALVELAVDYIMAREAGIDYLFANAGLYSEAALVDTSLETIDRIIDVNLKGIVYVLKKIIPIMQARRKGSIVLMGSDQSFIGRENNSIYGATKGAIMQLTKSTALECAPYGIRVNGVCPGAIMTPLTKQAVEAEAAREKLSAEAIYEKIKKTIPLGRFGLPEEVACAVRFLCSKESEFITGNLMCIDGGVVAAGRL